MAKITALEYAKRSGGAVILTFDDNPPLKLEEDVVVREGLKVGKSLSEEDLCELKEKNTVQKCCNAAAHLLSFRPRSKSEIRLRLIKKGYNKKTIETAICEMAEQKLLDDSEFARFWKDNRSDFSPRSSRMIKMELLQKGVSSETAEEAITDISDEEMALKAALPKAMRLKGATYEQFRQKIGGFLQRRGFSYGVTKETTAKLWQEIEEFNSGSD